MKELKKKIVFNYDIQTNVYYQNNKDFFILLKLLIELHPGKYSLILNSKGRKREPNVIPLYKYLNDWINEVTASKLSDKKYTTPTKCFWIMYNLQDFPECKVCKKQEWYKTRNVNFWTGYHPTCSRICNQNYEITKLHKEQTNILRYGFKNCFLNPNIIKLCEKTKLERYGDKNYRNSQKSVETKKLHAKTIPNYYKNINKKKEDTCINRYGVKNIALNSNFRLHASKKYKYDEIQFDSAPEVAFYIWLIDNNIKFKYLPCSFDFEFNGIMKKYFPDFEVNGQLIEIKGNQFLNKDGSWRCPWDHTKDKLYEVKHQVALLNNVKIMYANDYIFYIEYVEQKYGKHYLQKFKNKVNR